MTTRLLYLFDGRFFARELISKELKIKFVGSKLGAAWLVLEPLLLVLSLSAVFSLGGRFGILGTTDAPFPLFFYTGVLPWTFFASSLSSGPNVFLGEAAFLSKAAFPREILVIKYLGVSITEFGCSGIAFFILLAWYGFWPNAAWVYLPLFFVICVVLVSGIAFLVGSMHMAIRDTATLSRALLAMLFWFTPVVMSFNPDGPLRILYFLNPMVGVIEGCRQIILYGNAPTWIHMVPAVVISTGIFLLGYVVFRKVEKRFVDVL
jgi:lipopolysaccharide transport system permease protein